MHSIIVKIPFPETMTVELFALAKLRCEELLYDHAMRIEELLTLKGGARTAYSLISSFSTFPGSPEMREAYGPG